MNNQPFIRAVTLALMFTCFFLVSVALFLAELREVLTLAVNGGGV